MVRDVNIQVTYTNNDGKTGEMVLTVTGEQLEQTVKRRMQSLMPRTSNYRCTEVVQDALPLEIKKK